MAKFLFQKGNTINKGRKSSEETRLKISESLRGKMPKNIYSIAGWNKGTSKVKERNCLNCQVPFLPKKNKDYHKFCCLNCSHNFRSGENNNMWKGGKLEKICITCNKKFLEHPSGKKRCCSTQCMGKWQSKNRIGEKSPAWKGGITPLNRMIRTSLEYKLWRTAVFERDNYACIWCGIKSGNGKAIVLNADHIKPFSSYPALRFAIDNGRTLCTPCHKKTDTYGGKMKKYESS